MAQVLIPDDELQRWRKRITAAKNDRRRYEPLWQQCLAFAAGKHWLEWSRTERKWYLPKLKQGQYRYTVDELTQYRMSVLGELALDDDRPQVLFRNGDLPDEEFADMVNDAVGAGWENEWEGDTVLMDVKRTMIDLGTAAVRCRFDPTLGAPRANQVPFRDGKPITNPEKARAYVADITSSGASVDLRTIHEGRIVWDPGTPFNILVPPGVKREGKFPWEVWVEPVHLDRLTEEYGAKADGLKPDQIADVNQLGERELGDVASSDPVNDTGQGKLEDHVWVYTCYERPTRSQPKGRVTTFAGQSLIPLAQQAELPYRAPDGTYRSGVHYFHMIRLTDRFWSRGLIELGKEAQRSINKRRSQIAETIDRGQPFIMHEKGSIPERTGVVMEKIPVAKGAAQPIISPGVAVGPWMFQEVASLREDLQRAVGVRDVSLGQNPTNVGNYSQLALLRELDGRKLDTIITEFKHGTGGLVEDSVWDIHRYWGHDKIVSLAGPDGQLKSFSFDASKIPDFYRVQIAKGAAKPRLQAAQLKLIDDLAAYSINSQQPLPLDWLKESYDAGQPVDLPEAQKHDQLDKALLENQLMEQGQEPQPAYYDDHQLHIQVARSLQARADAVGEQQLSQVLEQHIQAHLQVAQQNALQHAADMQGQAAQAGGVPGQPAPADAQAAQGGGMPMPSPFSIFMRQGGAGNFGL